MIDVSPAELDIVVHILRRHVSDREVVAFGSRARCAAKPHSDLDLAVLGEQSLSVATLVALKDDFDESSLPFSVDVVDWATTHESFRGIIHRDRVPIKPAEPPVDHGQDASGALVSLGEIAEVFHGPHATPADVASGPILLNISNLKSGKLDLSSVQRASEEDFKRWSTRVKPEPGDVVFAQKRHSVTQRSSRTACVAVLVVAWPSSEPDPNVCCRSSYYRRFSRRSFR